MDAVNIIPVNTAEKILCRTAKATGFKGEKMTCENCEFYKKECESHAQMQALGMKRSLDICEIFYPKNVVEE
jgi:hypothetical protein